MRRIPDWEWLSEILAEFDITEKRFNRKNAQDFTSLEARIYREIQNRYKPREKPDYIKVVTENGRTSKQYEDSMRIHSEQVEMMKNMGYGLMLDGFTFYKIGHELQPWDFEQNFTMHHAYEIHNYLAKEKEADRE